MPVTPSTFTAVIVAGGMGTRMGKEIPKQFLDLGGKPVVRHCLETFASLSECEELVLVLPSDRIDQGRTLLVGFHPGKPFSIVPGGVRRQDSVAAGLRAVLSSDAWVAIHDAARPLIPAEIILGAFSLARKKGNAVVATSAIDTLVYSDDSGCITGNIDRSQVRCIQTPQIFPAALLRQALTKADEDGISGTDDAGLVQRLGVSIHLAPGSTRNMKLTTIDDLRILAAFL
ncbi:MAG: 2-C-methyl-D-erythritol 4-phosphate cytidylyltransferase [Candidatus Ozemobacteraceae bacterium]